MSKTRSMAVIVSELVEIWIRRLEIVARFSRPKISRWILKTRKVCNLLLPETLNWFFMKILTWNCRGAGSDNFRTTFNDLVKTHKPDIVFLLETKVSEERAETISLGLGFTGVCRAPTEGRGGGIWMLWRKEETRVDILNVDPQAIHGIIGGNLNGGWLCSGIYARPDSAHRENLWTKIEEMSTAVALPWMITGDFNEVISAHERRGGNLPGLNRCNRFKDMIDTCGLIDLGFRGPKFTWTNLRNGLARIRQRIDRCLANVDWQNMFPEGMVLHLPRTHSDHHPLLTLCGGMEQQISKKPFRFELAWTMDQDCKEVVNEVWRKSHSIFEAIGNLPEAMRDWNGRSFGNIFAKKRRLLARINGIQKNLCLGDHPFLISLETELIHEYNDVLKQEELLWATYPYPIDIFGSPEPHYADHLVAEFYLCSIGSN
ncbi:hypothetical protein RD792_003445 [Penstemon davidsonii]|uniref:Endonuclease/exonuclease/phosphatase domain-containing protein n=1 Tax=Penstemon davidsonii TaxID=160366 RepID=A0ABR0DTR5_9LAMI|nr:hypothetical protein RD792_003445 [Penstemon davidsonii]